MPPSKHCELVSLPADRHGMARLQFANSVHHLLLEEHYLEAVALVHTRVAVAEAVDSALKLAACALVVDLVSGLHFADTAEMDWPDFLVGHDHTPAAMKLKTSEVPGLEMKPSLQFEPDFV
mmetsp:Transcript_33517/g.60694  ORF Transcript_33517/g.60694 Transcript_33517/m.60694 type:complete len:121 (+) Transcript_33517:556-918(+)